MYSDDKREEMSNLSSSHFMNLSAVNSLFGCFLFEARGRFFSGFFCTDVVVYMDTSPSFCERHTDVVIGAQAGRRSLEGSPKN